ncbi:DUF4811 domain-containing protein [Fructobacillus ficulneus]|uniref:DUF4811 domain-containing protein n=1 Tax=Fructobacillus ficulneus TaxID=157463 RepID=A0A0K8MFQ3_9LACO|nr:DUF4811 domain-containing protein [Fructobacillus ficulneus]GAO99322.1 hypothetical protein FFIC_091500 [Fructobacillus ficulneus]
MILWIIVVLIVLAAASWLLIANRWLQVIIGAIFTIGAVIAVALLAANMDSHFGMEKQTVVTTKEVYSVAPAQVPVGMAAVKKIGTNNFVLVYKDKATDQQGTAHFVPNKNDVVEAVKQSANYTKVTSDKAQVKTTTTKWVYKSNFWRDMFKQDGEDNVIKVQHTLEVPTSWQIVEK